MRKEEGIEIDMKQQEKGRLRVCCYSYKYFYFYNSNGIPSIIKNLNVLNGSPFLDQP